MSNATATPSKTTATAPSKITPAKPIAPSAAPTAATPVVPPHAGPEANAKIVHPLTLSKDPAVYPLSEVPADYDRKKHVGLKPADFKKRSMYFDFKAGEHDLLAKELRERAEKMRKGGDGTGTGKANRLLKMMSKAADLRAELAAQGIDVDALLAQTKPAPAKAAEPVTALKV